MALGRPGVAQGVRRGVRHEEALQLVAALRLPLSPLARQPRLTAGRAPSRLDLAAGDAGVAIRHGLFHHLAVLVFDLGGEEDCTLAMGQGSEGGDDAGRKVNLEEIALLLKDLGSCAA